VVTDLLVRINATAAGYDAAMAKAQLSTYKFETSLKQASMAVAALDAEMAAGPAKAAATAEKALEAQRVAMLSMTKKIGTAFGVMGAAGAIGFGLVAKAAAAFDEKMATLASLIPHTAKQMDGLRTSAMNAGKDIAVSGTDAADAEIELAKAGISAADIMGGALRGALLLAAAGQTDVATATNIAASAMTQFGLKGKDIPHVADLLAAAADKSLGSVTDLGYALAQAGTTANQAGLSIEQTTGVLAEFAAAGLTGERGGTTFKQMLLQLEAPTDKAKELMQQFGLSLYDASGNMKSMPAIAGSLNKSFSDLEPAVRNAALATIFGSRAVQGANILMQAGAKTTDDWIKKVNDQGFAAQQAKDKLDSLNGDLERFKADISNAAVAAGESAQGPLRELVQILDALVGGFNGLPAVVKEGVVAILAITAVVGTLGFVFSRAIISIANMKRGLEDAGVSMGDFNKRAIAMRAGALAVGVGLQILSQHIGDSHRSLSALTSVAGDAAIGFSVTGGPWGAAIGGAIGLLTQFTGASSDAAAAQADLADVVAGVAGTLDKTTGAISRQTTAYVTQRLAAVGAYDAAKALGINLELVTQAAMGNVSSQKQLTAQLKNIAEHGDVFNGTLTDTGKNLMLLNGAVDRTSTGLGDAAHHIRQASGVLDFHFQQTAQGAKIENELGLAVEDTTKAVQHHTDAVQADSKKLEKWVQASYDAANAAVSQRHDSYALATAIDTATKSITDITGGLDKHTAAGQKNEAMIETLANQWNGSTLAAKSAAGAYEKTRQTMIDMLVAMGKSIPEAKALTTQLLGVPDVVREARLETAQAKADAKDLGIKLDDIKAPDLTAKVDTLDALHKVKDLGDFISRVLHDISDETVNVKLSAQALKVENTLSRFAPHAFGGPIRGPGSGTSDSIPAMLSAGEHVWTAAEVTRAGGHAVVEGLRRLAMLGELPKRGDISMFAGGGPVTIDPTVSQSGVSSSVGAVNSMFEHIAAMLGVALSKRLNTLLTQMSFGAGSPLGWAGSLTPAGLVRGQEFASSQVGKPYIWGGVGPDGYDCSGFQSAVLNSAHNAYPYRRLGSTAPCRGLGQHRVSAGTRSAGPPTSAGRVSGTHQGTSVA
jgi:TP901 family phage tail tape measure protein